MIGHERYTSSFIHYSWNDKAKFKAFFGKLVYDSWTSIAKIRNVEFCIIVSGIEKT